VSRRYHPTGQPQHRQAPGPQPDTVALIARVRAALDDGVRRVDLPRVLGETPGRVSMAMSYIVRRDGGTPSQRQERLPGPRSWGWQEQAACRGMDLEVFFGREGERGRERREAKAKRVCAGCPVRTECLDHAVGRPEKYGTWGGLNEDERAKERTRRLRQARGEEKAAS